MRAERLGFDLRTILLFFAKNDANRRIVVVVSLLHVLKAYVALNTVLI